eukprot:TRINITY_DN31783_c0_g1_i1.p1 TRINITY_DN31783_c0_g1~~TRINITY_DN31783_c0_g1_i1.p1  ORF type:complete len:504 (-),score=64.38 TRINITY_DN31783_c0_g1_i1:127-1638(-)
MQPDEAVEVNPYLLAGADSSPTACKMLTAHPEGLGSMMPLSEGSSLRGTIFNLVNTMIGGGILGLPFAMRQCGTVLGAVLLIVFAMLTDLAAWMLLVCVDATRQKSYALVGETLYGPLMGLCVDLAVFLNNLGVLISYVVVIGDLVPPFMTYISAPALLQNRASLLSCVALCILLPMSCLRSMGALRYTSLVCLFMILLLLILVVAMGTGIIDVHEDRSSSSPRLFAESARPVFTQMPVIVFAYNCAMNVPILYSELRRQKTELVDSKFGTKRSKMMLAMHTSVAAVAAIYCLVAVYGYLAFEEHTAPDILTNFQSDIFSPAPYVRVSYSLVLICSYPVMCFSCVASLHRLLLHVRAAFCRDEEDYVPFMAASPGSHALFPHGLPSGQPESSCSDDSTADPFDSKNANTPSETSRAAHLIEVVSLVSLTLILGVLLPNVSAIFGITGGLCGGAVTFVFPGLFFAKVAREPEGADLWAPLGYIMLALGAMLSVGTTLLVAWHIA